MNCVHMVSRRSCSICNTPPLDGPRLQRLLIERAEVLDTIEQQCLRRNDSFAVGDAENAGKDASLLRDLAAQLPKLLGRSHTPSEETR